MSVGKGGQRQTSSGSTVVDQTTQDYLRQVMEAAKQAGGAGASPLAQNASKSFTDMMSKGNFGMGVLKGDTAGLQTTTNPYQQQVIDANNAQWQNTNAGTMNMVNDAAA